MTGAPGPRLIARIAEGQPLIGIFACISAFQATEALADSPLDFITIEAEHAATDFPTIHAQVAALSGSGIPVVVRVGSGAPELLKPLLDLGIDGIMVANIESAAEAKRVVAGTRFAPEGERGIGGSVRSARFGRDGEYYKKPTKTVSVWLQIESQAGLDNLDAICGTPGVDLVFFGPMDLSARLGFPGQPSHPEVKATISRGMRRAHELGVRTGILTGEAECPEWAERGATALIVGSDVSLLVRAVDAQTQRLREKFAQPLPEAAQ